MQEENFSGEILLDEKAEKDRDWKGRRLKTTKLGELYGGLAVGDMADRFRKRSRALSECATFLEFRRYADNEFRLHNANFCKVRLCPMCAWRRSLKIFGQVSAVMDEVTKDREYRYIFLTLTARSVDGDALCNELDAYFKAFNILTRRTVFDKAVKGWFRALEITWNKATWQYHPHFHVVLCVNNSYFSDTKLYLSQAAWTSLWQSCLGVDYSPIVDVRKVKPNRGTTDNFSGGVAEIAKYAVKESDYLTRLDVVETLDYALERRRLVAFGGIMKDAHKRLNLGDAVDGDLIKTDNKDDIRKDLGYVIERYKWHVGAGNYFREE